jgi:TPR repeat protein
MWWGALTALVILTPVAVRGADDPPPAYASATEAYRQGASAIRSGRVTTALPALEYAAERGVLGAQLKLARIYASGRDVPRDDAKAFAYYQQIANQYADISPSSPVAKFIGESFVALGEYYVEGVPAMSLGTNPAYAATLFRHAASYFGNAEAQYRLARLYLDGEGVEGNVGLAVNWLAAAAKKQHPLAQATLGELLWRGEKVQQRRARGLALITLAEESAKASVRKPKWIGDLYQEAFANSDSATRKEAELLAFQIGGARSATATATRAKPGDPALAATRGPEEAAAIPATAPMQLDDKGQSAAPPAPIGMPIGFGAGAERGDLKP